MVGIWKVLWSNGWWLWLLPFWAESWVQSLLLDKFIMFRSVLNSVLNVLRIWIKAPFNFHTVLGTENQCRYHWSPVVKSDNQWRIYHWKEVEFTDFYWKQCWLLVNRSLIIMAFTSHGAEYSTGIVTLLLMIKWHTEYSTVCTIGSRWGRRIEFPPCSLSATWHTRIWQQWIPFHTIFSLDLRWQGSCVIEHRC